MATPTAVEVAKPAWVPHQSRSYKHKNRPSRKEEKRFMAALREVIAPYWQQRDYLTALVNGLPEETRFMDDPEQETKP